MFLRQSTIQIVKFGPGLDAGDGVALETGLATAMDNATTGIRISKDGGNYVDRNSSTAPAYDEMGDYDVTLDATDTNTVGVLRMIFEESATCLPIWQEYYVVEEAVYDAFFAASSAGIPSIPANWITAAGINADAITAAKVAADVHAESADATWDENIVSAHGAASAAGLLLRVLGAAISTRSNNATLEALLGVADAAGETIQHGIEKNVAFTFPFVMVDSAGDPVTGIADGSFTKQRSLDGATSWSTATGTVTEIGNGAYWFAATQADVNGDEGIIRLTATGAKAFLFPFITIA
jgi:hypothetical protein